MVYPSGSPFTDSAPDRASCRPVWLVGCGCGWVEHRSLIGPDVHVSAGRARTLLGPEKTPAWCFFWWTTSGLAGLTQSPVWCGWLWWRWWVRGVVVC